MTTTVEFGSDVFYETISKELDLSLEYVKKYFKNYEITHNMPIRTLDYQETMFVKAIKYIKSLSKDELKEHWDAYGIDEFDIAEDPTILERKLSGFTNDYHYGMIKKYFNYILEPALLFNNVLSPMLDRLTPEQELIILSNIATGRGFHGVVVKPADRLAAIQILETKPKNIPIGSESIRELSLSEIKEFLVLTAKDGVPSEESLDFAKEMAKLRDKRDGGEDSLVISERDQRKVDTLLKLTKPK